MMKTVLRLLLLVIVLGSDFDDSVTAPFDASGMAQVAEALLAGDSVPARFV